MAFGQLIQVDATFCDFFNDGKVYALHAAIDDATYEFRRNVDGRRRNAERILPCFAANAPEIRAFATNGILTEGPPSFTKGRGPEMTEGSKEGVQFAKWCDELGIELIETSVSQAKGRIERSWRTFKGRWKNELPLMGITMMEQFNERVEEVMAMHNKRFGTDPSEIENGFVPLEMSEEELDRVLTKRRERKADKGSCFSIDNKRVQLAKDDGTILAVEP